jgi:CRISPR-associated endonuclease/helicase Cas3
VGQGGHGASWATAGSASTGWGQHFDKHDDREAILEFVAELRGLFFTHGIATHVCAEHRRRLSSGKLSRDLSWWVAGLTVLADWLGSNTDYFPYQTEAVPLG